MSKKCTKCEKITESQTCGNCKSDAFLTSAFIGAVTGSTILGALLGGDIVGAAMGDFLTGDDE